MKFFFPTKLYFVFFVLLISSCNGIRYYTPEPTPTPLFNQKSQLYSELTFNYLQGINFGAAYAFSKHLAALGSIGYSNEESVNLFSKPDERANSENTFHTLGIGYFLQRSPTRRKNFETYLTWNSGNYKVNKYTLMKYGSDFILDYNSGKYNRISLLSNWGSFNPEKQLNFVYSIQLGMVQYNKPYRVYNSEVKDIYLIDYKSQYPLIDQSFTLLFGKNNFKFKTQFQFNFCPTSRDYSNDAINRFDANFHFGFVYTPRYYLRNNPF